MKHAMARVGLALLAVAVPMYGSSGALPHADTVPTPASLPTGPFGLVGSLEQGGLAIGTMPRGTVSLLLDAKPVPVARDGRFVIGFDRDAPSSALLVAVPTDGPNVEQRLVITPRAWAISRLSTLPKYPVPAPEFAAVRPAELARIVAARAVVTDAQGWRQHFRWPATGRLSTAFGSQRVYANGEAGDPHSGADVAVGEGTPVVAPADGVVVLAADAPFTLEGNLLMLDHGMGVNSALLHLSRILVRAGDHVRQGQLVAYSGKTGRATGPHLHWSLRWGAARVDPLLVVGAGPG